MGGTVTANSAVFSIAACGEEGDSHEQTYGGGSPYAAGAHILPCSRGDAWYVVAHRDVTFLLS